MLKIIRIWKGMDDDLDAAVGDAESSYEYYDDSDDFLLDLLN